MVPSNWLHRSWKSCDNEEWLLKKHPIHTRRHSSSHDPWQVGTGSAHEANLEHGTNARASEVSTSSKFLWVSRMCQMLSPALTLLFDRIDYLPTVTIFEQLFLHGSFDIQRRRKFLVDTRLSLCRFQLTDDGRFMLAFLQIGCDALFVVKRFN